MSSRKNDIIRTACDEREKEETAQVRYSAAYPDG